MVQHDDTTSRTEQSDDVRHEIHQSNGDRSAIPRDRSWPKFVHWALKHSSEFVTSTACAWESALWPFVRLLKGHPDFIRRTSWQALTMVEGVLFECACIEVSQPTHRYHWAKTEKFFAGAWRGQLNFEDDEEVRMAFQHEYHKVRYPLGGWGPLDLAAERAEQKPLLLVEGTDGYAKFISLAGWLQVTMGDRPILLPVTAVAERLGTSEMTVSRYRETARRDGLLAKVRDHVYRPSGQGKATEFRFAVDQFPTLLDAMQQSTRRDGGPTS